MTVKELRDKLAKYPENSQVYSWEEYGTKLSISRLEAIARFPTVKRYAMACRLNLDVPEKVLQDEAEFDAASAVFLV